MPRCYLVIHTVSYRFVRNVAEYIFDQLRRHGPREVAFHSCDSVDSIDYEPGSIIFVIGDPFATFVRRPRCCYVFVNFSLLYRLGGEENYGPRGRRWISEKHRLFTERIRSFDYALDCHPHQSEMLTGEFGVPCRFFPLGLKPEAYATPRAKLFDVCNVGTVTPRRNVLARRMGRSGIRLSPATGIALEDAAAQSKIVLNVHAYRTANVGLPRVVSALLSGAALVAENSADVSAAFPPQLYVTARYCDLSKAITGLLADPRSATNMAKAAGDWMRSIYLPRSDAIWARLVPTVYADLARMDQG